MHGGWARLEGCPLGMCKCDSWRALGHVQGVGASLVWCRWGGGMQREVHGELLHRCRGARVVWQGEGLGGIRLGSAGCRRGGRKLNGALTGLLTGC